MHILSLRNKNMTTQKPFLLLVISSLITIFPSSLSSKSNEMSDQTNISSQHFSFEGCTFTPPQDWSFVNPEDLPKQVKVLVQGKGKYELSPSINLSVESTSLDLKSYLNAVKELHESSSNAQWKKLGTIQTQAGPAMLTQVEMETKWGPARMMQTIMIRNHHAYILTTTARPEEFPHFYKDFFQSIQSLRLESLPQIQ